MKIFLMLCLFSLSSFRALADTDSAYCYSGESGYLVSPVAGFITDPQTAKNYGVCAFFYPAGTSFDSAPVVVYPNFMHRKTAGETLEQLIARDMEKFDIQSAVKIGKEAPLKSSEGNWQIRSIKNGPGSNAFENIAYIDDGGTVFVLVMSAQKEAELQKYSTQFRSFLTSIKKKKRSGIFSSLRDNAKRDTSTPAGKTFEKAYMDGFGPVMGKGMKQCFQKSQTPSQPFVLITKIDQTGLLTEATFDRPGTDVECLKATVQGHKGKAPPTNPFYLELEVALK